MEKKDYSLFTAADFLDDADFLRYVKYGYLNDVTFWEQWLQENPKQRKVFELAKLQLGLILSSAPLIAPQGFEGKLLADIKQSISSRKHALSVKRRNYYWASGIAASLIFALFSAWFFNSMITVQTSYGETRKISLPDGSQITLNANSTLSYPRAYAWKNIRTVDLNGEAYFKVVHFNKNQDNIKSGELFEAVTGGVEVQVLGTEFNLKERHGEAHIALINGRVQVKSKVTGKKYLMEPGNVIKVNAKTGELMVNESGSELQSAWTDGRLLVSQTSVNEIITAFEDLYGYKVILDNPALGKKKIDGSISIKSEQSLLFTLSNILNVNIKREGKIIRLQSR